MKGAKLNVNILTGLALALGLLMAILNFYPSWSQHAGEMEDPLLYSCLFCISGAFIIASFGHPEAGREITKVRKMEFRLRHCFRLVYYFFGGVIAFSVNNWSVETLHLMFTGASILMGYGGMLMYPETKKGHTWAFIGAVFGIGGFALGFFGRLYSVSWAEALAAVPLAVFMLVTWKR